MVNSASRFRRALLLWNHENPILTNWLVQLWDGIPSRHWWNPCWRHCVSPCNKSDIWWPTDNSSSRSWFPYAHLELRVVKTWGPNHNFLLALMADGEFPLLTLDGWFYRFTTPAMQPSSHAGTCWGGWWHLHPADQSRYQSKSVIPSSISGEDVVEMNVANPCPSKLVAHSKNPLVLPVTTDVEIVDRKIPLTKVIEHQEHWSGISSKRPVRFNSFNKAYRKKEEVETVQPARWSFVCSYQPVVLRQSV